METPAKAIGSIKLAEITELLGYLDRACGHGEPDLANELCGATSITLGNWIWVPQANRTARPPAAQEVRAEHPGGLVGRVMPDPPLRTDDVAMAA